MESTSLIRRLPGIALAVAMLLTSGANAAAVKSSSVSITIQKPQETKPTKARVQGLVWRVTSKDTTIYLIGSIHIGTKEMYPLPPIMKVAFDQASALVLELDPEKVDFASSFGLLRKYGMYAPGDSLSHHMRPDTIARLKKFCAANDVPEENLELFKPWLLSFVVGMLPMMKAQQSGGGQAYPGIDEYFAKKAHEVHKTIEGVETAEFQVKLISSLFPEDQEKALNAALNEAPSAGGMFDNTVDQWVKGDADAVGAEVLKDHLARSLVEDRNHHMADVADAYLKAHKSCLVVVGSAHMVGKEGIVELLRAKGYRVVQILSP